MVSCWVTRGSDSVKSGRWSVTGSDQASCPLLTAAETQVLPMDFDSDASWNTVSGSILSGSPTFFTPNPLA